MRRDPKIHGRHRNKPIESWRRKLFFPFSLYGFRIPEQEMPGYRGARTQCDECAEGINFHREVRIPGPHPLYPLRSGSIPSQWQRARQDGDESQDLADRGLEKSRQDDVNRETHPRTEKPGLSRRHGKASSFRFPGIRQRPPAPTLGATVRRALKASPWSRRPMLPCFTTPTNP